MSLSENDKWLLSFYRTSEISGALFFGRLARSLPPGPVQNDLTQHFADESAHSSYWTKALNELGANPLKINSAYQDLYIEAAGMPTNIMEILGITLIFEKRVIGQYAIHHQVPELNPVIKGTLDRIMNDEKWHVQWVTDALKDMEKDYGADTIAHTLRRYREADQEVYKKTLSEHGERVEHILKGRGTL